MVAVAEWTIAPDCDSGFRRIVTGQPPQVRNRMHFVYRTTCVITGKYYIGVHSTSVLEDGYLGSGLHLKRSVKKHGMENHSREILAHFATAPEAYAYESVVVTQELIDSDLLCMNLKPGGYGGWKTPSSAEQRARCLKGNAVMKNLRETDPEWAKSYSKAASTRNISSYRRGTRNTTGAFVGELRAEMVRRSTTPEARAKQKAAFDKIGHAKGEKNSQFGTCWVSNEIETKKISLEQLDEHLAMGYNRGRKKKTN